MSFQRADTARVAVPVVILSGQTVISGSATANGLLEGFTVVAPAITGTLTVAIADQDGTPLFSLAAIPQGNTFVYKDVNNQPLRIPIAGNHTVTITSSAAQAANAPLTVNLLITK